MVFSGFQAALDNAALKDIILERVGREGPLPFDEFLRAVLYHPLQGYYFRQDPSLDFQTSPNVHPVFGAAVASQLADMWRLLGEPRPFQVFEAGAGSGRLAADVMRALRRHEPSAYEAIEYTLHDVTLTEARAAPASEREGLPAGKVRSSLELPTEGSVTGCIFSNELLDALPFRRVRVEGGRLLEVRVGVEGERLVDVAGAPSPEVCAYFEALGLVPGEDCEAEVNLESLAWTRRAARALRCGFLLTLDYGYEAAELYAPWRKRGTLLTFYRQTAGDDPYARLGWQDITASIDFTSVRRAGEAEGLRTLGITTQAEFLAALGIGEPLARRPAASEMEAYVALRRAVMTLSDPAGLGRIRVLIQGRGVPDIAPAGLARA